VEVASVTTNSSIGVANATGLEKVSRQRVQPDRDSRGAQSAPLRPGTTRPPKPYSRGVRAALAPAKPAQTIVRLSVVMVGLCRQRQELLAGAGVVTDDAV
jgi:hypothetical protein